jgi:lipoate synthase
VKLFYGYWYIWISGKAKEGKYIDDFLACKELKKIVIENLAHCENCGHNCNNGLGYTVMVCGKKIEKVCGCCTVRFHNPNVETLNVIKNVIEKGEKNGKN